MEKCLKKKRKSVYYLQILDIENILNTIIMEWRS